MTITTSRRRWLLGAAALTLSAVGITGRLRATSEPSVDRFELSLANYDWALLPREHGQRVELGSLRAIERRYPSRDHCLQMAAFFNAKEGVLVRSLDPLGGMADWRLTGSQLRIDFLDHRTEVRVQPIPPDWRVAAAIYREWAMQQPWVTARRRPAVDLAFIATASSHQYEWQQARLLRLREIVGAPMAAWLTQWRDRPFDVGYPRYVGVGGDRYEAALQSLLGVGIRPLPYVNGLLWDQREVGSAPDFALRTHQGEVVQYNAELSDLHYACPFAASWRELLQRIQTHSPGAASGIYLDMLMAAAPLRCHSRSHGHAPGETLTWQKGVRHILKDAQGLLMSEGCAEVYLDLVDLPLMHLYAQAADAWPLWHAVYGSLCPGVGWQIPDSVSANDFTRAIERAQQFGSGCMGSPWLTHVLEEKLRQPEFLAVQTQIRDAARRPLAPLVEIH